VVIQNLNVQRELYDQGVIKKAVYKFRKLYCSNLRIVDDSEIEITFHFPDEISDVEKHNIVCSFQHELIDQSLREQIARETELTRNLILANAFSNVTIGE
jgi:His-Xaa-Ser system protein HxsD